MMENLTDEIYDAAKKVIDEVSSSNYGFLSFEDRNTKETLQQNSQLGHEGKY